MDMQDDTIIHGLTSYLLGDSLGMTGSILNIQSVSVNGVRLPVDGYIDIGLTPISPSSFPAIRRQYHSCISQQYHNFINSSVYLSTYAP